MNRTDFARVALNVNDPDQDSYFSAGFQYTDALGNPPMDWDTWNAMAAPIRAALSDLAYIIDDIEEEGDDVVVTGYFTGTFANDLDFSAMGMGVVPATDQAVRLPRGSIRLSFDGDQVCRIHSLETGADAGFAGLLKALGGNPG